ncbi:MAG TPA: ribosome biogenesis GTPase YlqF [Chromatiaceae bacterium]|jgi:ribosome biogenesis GTPase A|nr:ribosome biogenesis GTPase YlqF [Chromatiaceae bacterium]HIB83414.1 ribosome biogenesis GTPase YlqF [Chromatiaceae bacterium]HIO14074.1 ribosome biogenesis GTPase YlqF [Chromatiales bacterium]
MQIQWYPGHMHKANKAFKEALPQVDLIIEILDARIPHSSENPLLAELRGDKPCIKVLNKSDLADPDNIRLWQDSLDREQNVKTLALSQNHPERIQKLTDLCHKMVPHRSKVRLVKAIIAGIPNVGKSTLINTLAGRTIAKTGNEPAVTKIQQRIPLDDGIVLFDTPGVLWPNIENRHSGYRLAATGAIKDTAMEYEDVAFYTIDYLLTTIPDAIGERYDLDVLPKTELEALEAIGRKRGCLRGGGQVDLNKVSKLFLTELRAGMLGPISLETPIMVKAELIEVEQKRQIKAEKKATRMRGKSKKR